MIPKDVFHQYFSRVRLDYWVCLLLAVATLSVYWQVRDFEFINYDDPLYVAENRYVQKGLTLETVKWSFTDATRKTNYWVPLTWLSILLDYELYGMNAGGYHLTNVFFHVLNTLLVFVVFRRLSGALWQSAFVAALFGLHPLHVESVAWVTERKDVLSTLFWLLTLLSYGGYVRRPGAGRYLSTLLLFILGMMSKPMLVTLPFVLLLLDYWPLGRLGPGGGLSNLPRPAAVWKLVWEKGPFFIIVGIAGVAAFVTQQAAGAVKTLAAIPLAVRIPNVLVAYVSYIGKMFWPLRLSFLYPHPGALPVWQWFGALLILAAITYGALRFIKERPYLAVGWLWYLGTLFPVSGIVVIGPHAMADRYTYVPLLGLYLMLAWGVAGAAARWRYKTAGLALAAAVILALLAGAAGKQVRYWQNSVTLMEHAIAVTDNNYVAHFNIGIAYESEKKLNDAIRHYAEALRIEPDSAEAHNNLGLTLSRQGEVELAIGHYYDALRCDPGHTKAHNNLGNALVSQGKIDEALVVYRKALSLDAENAEVYNNLGLVLIRQAKFPQAIHHFQEAVRINNDFRSAWNNLKRTVALQQKIDSALLRLAASLEISPEGSGLTEKVTILKESGNNFDDVVTSCQKTLSFQPGFTPKEFNIDNYAKASEVKRKYQRILPLFERLINLDPNSPEAYYHIACIYALQKKAELSYVFLERAVKGGFNDRHLLENDKNLESIRKTSFFKSLIRTL